MENQMEMPPFDRRQFLALTALTGVWVLEGCKGDMPWDKEKKPSIIQARYGTSIKEALAAKAALDVRDTRNWGEEIIAVGKHRATSKGSGIIGVDDGFVVLVKAPSGTTTLPLSALNQNHLFDVGVHAFDVRYVPPGVDGKNVAPFMVFDVKVV